MTKHTSNFEAARELLRAAQETRRTLAGGKRIAKACDTLGFTPYEKAQMFVFMEYADRTTGAPYPYPRGRSGGRETIPGQPLWDVAAYLAEHGKGIGAVLTSVERRS
jgi:hypothetical protein